MTNLPPNAYHLYLYGHAGTRPTDNALFKLYRSGIQLGYKGTTIWGSAWNSTNWEAGQQYVVFKNIAVTNQHLDIVIPPGGDGYCYICGLQIVPSSAVPPDAPAIAALINVDLGATSTSKTGPAAVGLDDSDFWNSFASPYANIGSTVPLYYSDTTASTAGMTVWNAPGDWGNGVSDPMYNHCHPVERGGVCWKYLNMDGLHNKNGVSDMEEFAAFSAPAVPYCGKNARWKNNFFAGHGVGSPATISSLRRTLHRQLSSS